MNHDTSTDTTKSPRALKIFATSTVLAIAAVCLPGCTDPGFFQRSEELKAQDAALVVRLATIEAQQDATSTMLATATGEARDKLIVVSDALVAQKAVVVETQAEVRSHQTSIETLQADVDKADAETIDALRDTIGTLPPSYALPAGLIFTTLLGFWRSWQARQNTKQIVRGVDEVLTDGQKAELSGIMQPKTKLAVRYAKGTGPGLPI